MPKSLRNKLYLKQHLYSHPLVEGTFFIDHIYTFKEIFIGLEIWVVKYDEEDVGLILCVLCLSPTRIFETLFYIVMIPLF